jgi:hypothetical protein
MKHKHMIWTILVIFGLLLMGTAAVSAQSDQAKLVVINYVGTELVFTLDGTDYRVPGTDVLPGGGQMEFSLTPGVHDYSGVVPGGPGANGQVDLAAGQTYVVGARVEQTPAVISSDGVVLQKPKDKLVLFEAAEIPGVSQVEPTMTSLQPIPADMGALVLDNYIGEELTVDIDGTIYTVPANGRLQIDLNPGEVTYTASVSTSSLNATAEVVVSEYTGLGFSRDYEEPVEYKEGEPEPTPIPLDMYVDPVDLSGAAMAGTEAGEEATEEVIGDEVDMPAAKGVNGVTVINYTGKILTFTLLDKQYVIAEDVLETQIELGQGEYGYTAAVPAAAHNGSFVVDPGQMVRLSISMSEDGNALRVYFE